MSTKQRYGVKNASPECQEIGLLISGKGFTDLIAIDQDDAVNISVRGANALRERFLEDGNRLADVADVLEEAGYRVVAAYLTNTPQLLVTGRLATQP